MVAIARKSGEVTVEERAGFRAAAAERRVDRSRDRRVPSVGANRQRRGRTETKAGPALDALDAVHPAVVGQHARHPRRDADLGACDAGGFDQQRIEHGSAWGVQRRYATARADVDGLDFVVAVRELGRTNGRCARVDDRVEQTPTVQLQHTAAHERVGGQGVGARPGRLDDEHSHAAAGQQHRGGRTGAPAADDGVADLADPGQWSGPESARM